MRSWTRFAGLALGAALAATPALAHRMDAALSVVELQADGTVEVSHRLFAHDLEHALDPGPVGLRWFEMPAGQVALRDYVAARFVLNDARGRPVALRFVGAEVQGDLVWIYFEGRRPSGRFVTVDSDLLQDVSDRQTNQVNVRAGGRTRTAIFPPGAEAKRVPLG